MKRYRIELDWGMGGSTTIEADSPEDALDAGLEWAATGEWGDVPRDPCEQYVRVSVLLDGEEILSGAYGPWEVQS